MRTKYEYLTIDQIVDICKLYAGEKKNMDIVARNLNIQVGAVSQVLNKKGIVRSPKQRSMRSSWRDRRVRGFALHGPKEGFKCRY